MVFFFGGGGGLRIQVFWDVTLWCRANVSQRYEGQWCLHLQGSSSLRRMLDCWRCRHYVPLNVGIHLPSDILETKNPQCYHFENLKMCTFAFSLAGSSHINTVRIIRWKFFKWWEDDDHNTDWWRSARSSNQWYSGDVSFELESRRSGVFISLPFLLTRYSFNYMSVPHHAPRKFIQSIKTEKCKFQLSFLYKGT